MYQFMFLLLSVVVCFARPEMVDLPASSSDYVILPSTTSLIASTATYSLDAPVDYNGPKVEVPSTSQVQATTQVQRPQEVTTAAVPQELPKKAVDTTVEVQAAKSVNDYVDNVDNLLKKYVNAKGGVDYDGLSQASAELNRVAAALRDAYNPKMARNEGLAYYINLYNVHTLKLIVDNYPVASITDLHGGEPWKHKWIDLGGTKYSLDHIEHTIIRPTYGDPRIHFAVNCAAATCPPLLNAAYKASTVDKQLESQSRKFINNTSFNKISGDALQLSKIFKWYGEDFTEGVTVFVSRYTDVNVSDDATVTFLDYDWSLNKQ